MARRIATLKYCAMSEDGDWYAFPASLSKRQVASELVHNFADWWLSEHEAVWVDDDDATHGWVTAYRDLFSKVEMGHVRLGNENDDFDPYYDEWWFECEADHSDAEPAWIVRF